MKNTESIKFGDTVPVDNIPFDPARRLAVVLLWNFLFEKLLRYLHETFSEASLYVVSKLSESLHTIKCTI